MTPLLAHSLAIISYGREGMRNEIVNVVDEIQQAVGLLRRHL